MAKLSPVFNDTQFDDDGNLLVGGLIYTYAANSSTPLATYTDDSGTTPHSNPIVLDARGEVESPIWLAEGNTYKLRLFDALNNFIREFDDIAGVGDNSITLDQWVASGVTPTYVSANQFTLPGDQTSAFQVNRRIKATVTAGTVYGYIAEADYDSLTIMTVVLDSGSLDAGLSAVQFGLITPDNTSLRVTSAMQADGSITTVKIADGAVTTAKLSAEAKTAKIQDVDASVASNALTVTVNPGTWDFRSTTLTDGTPVTRTLASAASVVVPDGATLGTISGQSARLVILAIDNAGTVETAIVNLAGGLNLDETTLISTTAISTGADSANVIYSTTARTNVAYRVVGFIDISEVTAGTWATAPTKVQGAGGQAFSALSSLGYGQTWQNLTGTRAGATTYYNTTGRPIYVQVKGAGNSITSSIQGTVDGLAVNTASQQPSSFPMTAGFIVPPGSSYSFTFSSITIQVWSELR